MGLHFFYLNCENGLSIFMQISFFYTNTHKNAASWHFPHHFFHTQSEMWAKYERHSNALYPVNKS